MNPIYLTLPKAQNKSHLKSFNKFCHKSTLRSHLKKKKTLLQLHNERVSWSCLKEAGISKKSTNSRHHMQICQKKRCQPSMFQRNFLEADYLDNLRRIIWELFSLSVKWM